MLKIASYDIVFQEIPDEVTLALNLSLCPNRCHGCHSEHLQNDCGEILNEETLNCVYDKYKSSITCLAFMGGDNDPHAINKLAQHLRTVNPQLKIAWYSGQNDIDEQIELRNFDFIKIGEYIERLGGLKTPTTNQILFQIDHRTNLKKNITKLIQ